MVSSSQSGARGFTNDTETRGDEALSMETALGVETGKAAVPWSTPPPIVTQSFLRAFFDNRLTLVIAL